MENKPIILSAILSDKYVILNLDKTPFCLDGQIAISENGDKALVLAHKAKTVTINPLFEFVLGRHFKVNESISFMESATTNDLSRNRGHIYFDREFLTCNPTEDYLLAIFSNFFPIMAETNHERMFFDKIKMSGYSKHFRKLEEGESIPEYEIVIMQDDNGCHFDRMVEVNS